MNLFSPILASVPLVFNTPPEPPPQFHDATYQIGWDIKMSPYAGGEDILFAHRCIERFEGWMISKSPVYYSKAPAARIWRLSELVMGWLPVNYLAVVAQHEVFGHGYRIRDIRGARVIGYSIAVPPPYGPGGGATSYEADERYTTTDGTCVDMAGVESTAILALLAKFKWLESGKIDPRQTMLYLLGQYDLPLYIGTIKAIIEETTPEEREEVIQGHDMISYVRSLNQTYTQNSLSVGRLRSITWINLADPFTYYSIYAWFHYIASGKETSIPMIPLYGYGYLPGVRFALTPFGPEYFFENFLLSNRRPYYFYLKAGRHSKNNYYGAGCYAPKIYEIAGFSVGARVDLFRQPKLLLFAANIPIEEIDFKKKPDPNNPPYSLADQHKMHWGAGVSAIFDWQIGKSRSGFQAELGYKTAGFIPGESLYAYPIVRTYYTLSF